MEKSKKIVIGNMKMNMSADEISTYLKKINNKVGSKRVVICPTSIFAPYFLGKDYRVGLQNIFYNKESTVTGEISPRQASSLGIFLTILGHSERRNIFKETDALINLKVKDAIKENLKVVLCIGETEEEKSLMRTDRVLKRQLTLGLKDLTKEELENIVIAYEPCWAIGTGIIPKNKEIERTTEYIKLLVKNEFDFDNIPVLYGGSVNEKNIENLNKIPNLQGFLVGGASTDPNKFLKIIEVALQ